MADVVVERWSDERIDALELRRDLVDRETLVGFVQKRPARLALTLGFDFLSIVLAAAASEMIDHPAAYVLAVMWIGGRQVGIGSIALHEGVHRLLLRDHRLNDMLARALLWSVLARLFTPSLHDYRRTHAAHHRSVNSEDDPDRGVTSFMCGSRARCAALLVASLSGVLGLYLLCIGSRHSQWRRRIAGTSLLAVAMAGVVWSVRPIELFAFYYLVPLLTWGLFVNQVRVMAEHYPRGLFGPDEDLPDVLLTREVLPTWFDRWFVTTRSVNYHLTHHLFPAVPFYNLRRLQRVLGASGAYASEAHVTRGYHRFIVEHMTRRPRRSMATQV